MKYWRIGRSFDIVLPSGGRAAQIMGRVDTILAAVQDIHQAPLSCDGWTRALPSIAGALRSEHGILTLQSRGGTTEFAVSFGMTSEQTAGFGAATDADTAFWGAVRALPIGSIAPTSALLPDRDYANTVFYNEGVRPIGAFHGLLVSPLSTPHWFVHLSTGRPRGCQDYDAEDRAVMRALLPHVVIAFNVTMKLATADWSAMGAADALDRLHAGVILVDVMGGILFTNRSADAILAGNDGLSIDDQGIRACSHGATRALRRLIAGCADIATGNDGPGGDMELPRGEGRGPLRVTVAPFRANAAQFDAAQLGGARPVAILLLNDTEQEQHLRKEKLCQRFGLTPAETDVAFEIIKGDGRDAAAARLGISAATVRAHLSHIFEKTGVHRQAGLVNLLMQGDRPPRRG